MKRSIIACVIGLGLVAGCKNPADDVAKAKVEEKAAVQEEAQAAEAPKAAELPKLEGIAIGPAQGTVGFVGSKVTGSHEGLFQEFSGTIDVGDGKPESAKVAVEIELSSVKTDNEKLDGHLKSADFFDVAQFPKATFVSTSIKAGGEEGASYTVTGDLTLRGVTKSISFPATIAIDDQQVTVKSDFAINRKDFKIMYPGKPDDLIRDEVVIKLDLKAARQAS